MSKLEGEKESLQMADDTEDIQDAVIDSIPEVPACAYTALTDFVETESPDMAASATEFVFEALTADADINRLRALYYLAVVFEARP